MSPFPAARAVLQDAIETRAFPGAAFGVLQAGQPARIEAIGSFTYAPEAPAVTPQTIFDLASVTKVLATTAMAMLLLERGLYELDTPVASYLPEWNRHGPADPAKGRVAVRMLLDHSSGLPAYARLYETCPTKETMLQACLRMPLESLPGTAAVYSDIGFLLLGHLLETLAGEPLDRFCEREIFAPLGMDATQFCPPPALHGAIPPTAESAFRRPRRIQGEVHDDNCWSMGGISGHAGLFANVVDVLRFAECILKDGDAVFRSETISTFTQRQQQPPGSSRALGWDTPSSPSSTGNFFSAQSIGHLGYTGTSLWIDREKQLAVVLLTNRTFPAQAGEPVSNGIQQVRPRFHNAVLTDLGWAAPQP